MKRFAQIGASYAKIDLMSFGGKPAEIKVESWGSAGSSDGRRRHPQG